MNYTPASAAMLEHRYGAVDSSTKKLPIEKLRSSAGTLKYGDHIADAVADEMFGSLPVAGRGAMQLHPVVAPGIDTGSVELVPLHPPPDLTPHADDGIAAGFAEFMREYTGRGP